MVSVKGCGLPSFIGPMAHRRRKQPMSVTRCFLRFSWWLGIVLLMSQKACAGSLRDRIMERRAEKRTQAAADYLKTLCALAVERIDR